MLPTVKSTDAVPQESLSKIVRLMGVPLAEKVSQETVPTVHKKLEIT